MGKAMLYLLVARTYIIAISFMTKHYMVMALPSDEVQVQPKVTIIKCCEENEIYYDSRCTVASDVHQTEWVPKFTGYKAETNVVVDRFSFLIGFPDCRSKLRLAVNDDPENHDHLFLFPDGKLGYYIKNLELYQESDEEYYSEEIYDLLTLPSKTYLYHHFDQRNYCIEKAAFSGRINEEHQVAFICEPEKVLIEETIVSNSGLIQQSTTLLIFLCFARLFSS